MAYDCRPEGCSPCTCDDGLCGQRPEMTAEEIGAYTAAERARVIAAYTGPVVLFEVATPFYLGSCDSCGWVGSTELCPPSAEDAICPRCFSSGVDCGKVAERIGQAS